jgi:hypothetical protein
MRVHPILVWGALSLLLFVSFCVDFGNVQAGGAIDLRNRITGVRLLLHHIDPYFYKWHEGDPPEYCDFYNNPGLPVSKTTSSPPFLLLHAPVAGVPYRLTEFLWFFLQWLLLLGTAWLWIGMCATSRQRLLLATFVTGLTYTPAWRLHVERGQSYVLLLFLFAAWLGATLRNRTGESLWAGMLAGFLVALRPPFLLLAPFLLMHRRGQGRGALLGLLLGVVIPMCWRGDIWEKYFAGMETQSSLYLADIQPPPGRHHFPRVIEGTSAYFLGHYSAIPFADYSVHKLLRGFGLEPFPALPVLALFVICYGGWLWWSRAQPMPRLLLGLAVFFFLADLFLPAYRNLYNDVLIVNVVALGLIAFEGIPWGQRLCFLALPAGWIMLYFSPENDWLLDLPSFILTLGGVLLLFRFDFPVRRAELILC